MKKNLANIENTIFSRISRISRQSNPQVKTSAISFYLDQGMCKNRMKNNRKFLNSYQFHLVNEEIQEKEAGESKNTCLPIQDFLIRKIKEHFQIHFCCRSLPYIIPTLILNKYLGLIDNQLYIDNNFICI